MKREVVIIGGGPAGLAAAIEAKKDGCDVLLIDENRKAGGQLFKQLHKFFGSSAHRAGVRGIDIGKELLEECVRAIKAMIDRTPPNVRNGIRENGICLTGGMANLRGLATYLRESTGLPVMTMEAPELCAVKGLQRILQDRTYYSRLTYSMMDEDYRWLR